MQTANPALSIETFDGTRWIDRSNAMTMQGVVIKTAVLLLITLLSAGWLWFQFYKKGGDVATLTPWMIGGAIGGLILALVTAFKPAWSAMTAPLYALLEGLFIGGISAVMELSFPGIVIQATMLTFGTLFAMLAVYQAGWVKVTENFKLGLFAATGGIALVYLVSMVLGFFHIQVPFIYGSGWVGIAFSLFVVAIAALNLVLDFDFIQKASRQGQPKYMEWYCGFALLVTLVWLYIEILRLLSKMRSRE